MNENEKLQDQELNLDDIMKEFASESEEALPEGVTAENLLEEVLEETEPAEAAAEEPVEEALQEEAPTVSHDTVRVELPKKQTHEDTMGDTVRLDKLQHLVQEEQASKKEKEEPYGEKWQPQYEQPIGEYVPPQPIIFHPRSHLRELKRKLVAGPERRYYEINEIGFGKLQAAIFLSFLIVVVAAGSTALYALNMVQESRMKLLVFFQIFSMLVSALLGSYQLLEGIADLFKGRFTLDTMLVFTFIACCADGVLCLQELRVPCCAAFSLQVTMSLWGAYHRRSTEMAMMDTMRKATNLSGIKPVAEYYDKCTGLLREEGEVEDFMDHYRKPSGPEKVFSWYAFVALLLSIGNGAMAMMLHGSVSFGLQVLSVSLLAAVPVTSFITLTRPMAILERRLHKLGTVLCGWRGVVGLSKRAVFPVSHEDLFPVGSCKLNGVKFYGTRDPDQVVAYCTALVSADGGGLVPIFEYLLSSRNGRHYDVENFRGYEGGIGGEVCGEPVLMGTLNCLKDMGVEIPEGTSVSQAVYAAIDGEFCGVFAVTYAKAKSSVAGLRTMCAYRGLRPILVTEDFMLTESFIRSRFSVNTRHVCFPQRADRAGLAAMEPESETPSLALITSKGLAPYAFAITGARSVLTASWIGVVIHLLGGIVGLAMMGVLSYLGEAELLTPANLLLYEMVWLIPGLLITEWTRSV